MMSTWGIVITCLSVALFPWQCTALLVLAVSFFEPLMPLIAGLMVDTLYYVPHGEMLPLCTVYGLLTTLGIFFVRDKLKTSSIDL